MKLAPMGIVVDENTTANVVPLLIRMQSAPQLALFKPFARNSCGHSRYAGSSIQVNDALGAVDLDQGAVPG
jgi:hypothetical protein